MMKLKMMVMMTEDIKSIFESSSLESYSRFNSEHPFDVYLGIDRHGRKSLSIIMRASQVKVTSTKTISVQFSKRDDGKLMLSFGLEDNLMSDIFYKFCEDIIENTRDSSEQEGFLPITQRWETWIRFFLKTLLPLSEAEVLGLIGEVYFLQHRMVAKYGIEAALESYIGVDKTHKDFEIENSWYEVKSTHNGARAVKISSIEQLDDKRPGKLEIITFDQSTYSSKDSISLNRLIKSFRDTLDRKWQLLFDDKMRKTNYIEDDRYDDHNYIFVRIDEYDVMEDFPRLRKDTLPVGVSRASYEIDISAILRYKVVA